jgi:hypothetical protein
MCDEVREARNLKGEFGFYCANPAHPRIPHNGSHILRIGRLCLAPLLDHVHHLFEGGDGLNAFDRLA